MSVLQPNKRRKLSPARDDATTTNKFYQNAANWNLEATYAQKSKKQKLRNKGSDKLPIKKGGVVEQAELAIEEDNEESGSESKQLSASAPPQEAAPAPQQVEDVRPLKVQILEAKEELAKVAGLISEDPEEHISQLKNLDKLARNNHVTIRRLAMVAQLAIYRDIIPGYRIRPVSEEDYKARLSKDVKRLRNFEQTLVTCYRDYVHGLARATKLSKSREPSSTQVAIASTAYVCICTLLTTAPHFNFRSDLLNALVNKVVSREIDADYDRCVQAIETLFQNDEEGNSSLEAVALLTKAFKSKDYNIHPAILNTFLHLRLLSEYSHRASTNRVDKDEPDENPKAPLKKKNREFRTKRERKKLREQKSIQKEFREADAVVGHEERDRHQSEILKMVFVAYFRILKQRKQSLMGAVLEGLARYAHLINQDFFGDILEALRDLIATLYTTDDEASTEDAGDEGVGVLAMKRDKSREMLLCTVTAFALLQGQDVAKSASTLHLDLSFFTKQLYNSVLPLALDARAETYAPSAASTTRDLPSTTPTDADDKAATKAKRRVDAQTPILLLLRSLTSLLLPGSQIRTVPAVLLAAFTKRLVTGACHTPERSTLALLALVQQVVKVHGSKVVGLWYTEERRGDGVFDMERDEWGSANAFAASVWEGELLRCHWSEKVREAWREVERAVISRRG